MWGWSGSSQTGARWRADPRGRFSPLLQGDRRPRAEEICRCQNLRSPMPLPTVVTIRHILVETRWIRTFVLDASLPEAEPGQFVMLWLPGVDEKPFSIARPDPLTLTCCAESGRSARRFTRRRRATGWGFVAPSGVVSPDGGPARALWSEAGTGLPPCTFWRCGPWSGAFRSPWSSVLGGPTT